jgi:hypothetical protein
LWSTESVSIFALPLLGTALALSSCLKPLSILDADQAKEDRDYHGAASDHGNPRVRRVGTVGDVPPWMREDTKAEGRATGGVTPALGLWSVRRPLHP